MYILCRFVLSADKPESDPVVLWLVREDIEPLCYIAGHGAIDCISHACMHFLLIIAEP